jgi:N-acyl-L-homoserine lactone synthetase
VGALLALDDFRFSRHASVVAEGTIGQQNTCWSVALAVLKEEFLIEIADTPEHREEAHRLRYQTYCIERGYESSATGLEIDEFDYRSRHAILRHRQSHQAVGTVRLVLPCPDVPHKSFPMQRLCDPQTPLPLPVATTAEISRFAIPKGLRSIAGSSSSLLRLGLMRGVVLMSQEYGLTHWCALMQRPLLRLLQSTAIYFHPVGPLIEHHGLRQPCYGNIHSIFARGRDEQAAIWEFMTDNQGISSLEGDSGRRIREPYLLTPAVIN